jgi:SET domain-containing protein
MLIVKKSRIPNAGKGLFTTSPIRKGDLIVEYKGEKMSWAKCLSRYGDDINDARYLYFVSSKNCIDAQNTPKELARYANDAGGFNEKKGLSNNSEYTNIKGVPHIIATKNIAAGSEILVDYSGDYWKLMKMEMKEKKSR